MSLINTLDVLVVLMPLKKDGHGMAFPSMVNQSKNTLSDFCAFAIADDWLTSVFIDSRCYFRSRKVLDTGWSLPVREDSLLAALDAATRCADMSEGARRKAVDEAVVNFIVTNISRSYNNARVRAYLREVLSLRAPRNSHVRNPRLRRSLPENYTCWHLYLLLRQTGLYLRMLSGSSQYEVRATQRFGEVPEGAVFSKVHLKENVVIPDLVGTLVPLTEDDEKAVPINTPHWDFSVVLSERGHRASKIMLGPARFVNHSCEPNVKV